MRDLDRLYQLPLAEFTEARNALAKTGGAGVRALAKPTLPAWAVNQLYWRDRRTWDALITAAEAQRRTHHAVLAGRKGDLRAAGKAHDEAVNRALAATLAIASADGHPITEATRTGILTTLRALPGDEPAGRLTRTLQPGGFEMLAGLTIAGGPKAPPKPAAPRASAKKRASKPAVDRKAVTRARAQVDEATKKVRQAEQAAAREEFEAARTAREAEKAERAAAEARDAYEAAREALEEAEAAVPPAAQARDAATRRARKAADALDAAQQALDDAKARLGDLET